MNDDLRAVLANERRWAVVQAHALDGLRELPDGCAQMACCSPPYWRMRKYPCDDVVWGGDQNHAHEWGEEIRIHVGGLQKGGGEMTTEGRTSFKARNEARESDCGAFCACGSWKGQLGQEPLPGLYIEHLVLVFAELRRVLADDGLMFIVIGDSYASSPPGCADGGVSEKSGLHGVRGVTGVYRERLRQGCGRKTNTVVGNLKPKDMVGIPWTLALALRDDGWWLRDEIIWHKSATTPFPATDRTVRAHEQVFLLAKRARYFFDWEAISEPSSRSSSGNTERKYGDDVDRPGSHFGRSIPWEGETRRARSVWTINPEPTREDHYAAYPTELARRLVAAGSRPGDVVLDPFAGISRTGRAALLSGRRYVGMDLSEKYVEASRRTCEVAVAEDQARIVEARDERVRKGLVAKAEARKFEQIGMLFGDERGNGTPGGSA